MRLNRILMTGLLAIPLSLAVTGLAAQDTAENALAELSLDDIRLKSPVFHGDTLYAFSKVVSKSDAERDDAGVVEFHHWGVNE